MVLVSPPDAREHEDADPRELYDRKSGRIGLSIATSGGPVKWRKPNSAYRAKFGKNSGGCGTLAEPLTGPATTRNPQADQR
jgi:hypothetical protein